MQGGWRQKETSVGADQSAEGPRSGARVRLGRRETEVHQQVRGVFKFAQETFGHFASSQRLLAGPSRDPRKAAKTVRAFLPGSLRAHVWTQAG